MKLIIDDANLDTIKGLYEYFPVDGVTTNPTILAKEGKNPYEVLMAIREFIGPDAELHVQVVGKNADLIYEEAHMIRKRLGNNTFIKVPVTREGLKAPKSGRSLRMRASARLRSAPTRCSISAWATRASLRLKRCAPQSSARWPNALPRSCMVTPPPQGYPPRARLLPLRSTGVSAPHMAWGTSL